MKTDIKKFNFFKLSINFILFILICSFFLLSFHKFNSQTPSRNGDDAAYFNTAFNIEKYGVASHQVEEFRIYKHKNLIKPPFYSYILSLFLKTDGKYQDVSLECIYSDNISEICLEFVQSSKKINLGIHFVHSIILFFTILIFTKNYFLSFAGGLIIFTSSFFLNNLNYFMTETLSTTLLLLNSIFLYLFFKPTRYKNIFLIFSSIFLGLLILTKAVYLYYFYFLFFFFLFINLIKFLYCKLKISPPNFSFLLKLKHTLIFFIIVLIFIYPWKFRNFIDSGQFKISLQGGNVIAERAEYLKTDIKDIKYGIIFYLPFKKFKNNFKDKLENKIFMFDEANPNSHYQNSDDPEKSFVLSKLDWKEKNKPDKVFNKSVELIKEEPIKHIYLSLMFFVRGIFLETNINKYPLIIEYISSFVHWSSVIFIPIIFLYLIIIKNKYFILILPSIFTIFTYSFFTDFEPRYGSVIVSTYVLLVMIFIKEMFIFNKNEERNN